MGALLPKYGQSLALALQLDRVLLVGRTQSKWERNVYCGDDGHFDNCYFLPFSNCTLDDALQGKNLWDVPKYNGILRYSPHATEVHVDGLARKLLLEEEDQSAKKALVLTLEEFGEFGTIGIPHQFLELLSLAPIDRDHYYYWWRAQSMAYILRPNARTRFEIEMRRLKMTNYHALPSGIICVQIRHGDKEAEAPSAPDDAYLRDVHRLLNEFPELDCSVYIATLDKDSLRHFESQHDLTVFHTELPRYTRSQKVMSIINDPW